MNKIWFVTSATDSVIIAEAILAGFPQTVKRVVGEGAGNDYNLSRLA